MYTNYKTRAHGCRPAFTGNHYSQYSYRRPKFNVPLNIADYQTYFEVHLFASGFTKEDIKVHVSDDILYLTGNKELPEGSSPEFHRQEFPIKNFERMLQLNGLVDVSGISARHENGILKVTLPKSKEAAAGSQEITIQ